MSDSTPRPPEVRWQRKGRSRSVRATVAILAVVVVAIAVGFLALAWVPVRHARDAYLEGHVAQSIDQAERWSGHIVWDKQFQQILAAAYLTAGKTTLAEPHVAALRGDTLWLAALDPVAVAQRMFARGRYAEYASYGEASHAFGDPPDAALYRAAASLAAGRIADAEAAIASLDRKKVNAAKLHALETALAARKAGSYPLALDRNGGTIATYQLANHDLVAVDATFAPLIEKDAGAVTFESQLASMGTSDLYITTLDPRVQQAALAALGGFRGSLVAIDPRTNEILAIASNRGNGPLANLALERQYEPGSVVKVLTASNAIASGIDMRTLFPFECKGELTIDGRRFADWVPQGHGVLPSLDEALAESCNIAFADIGLRLGNDRLQRFMRSAGFDGQVHLGMLDAPLGRIIGPVPNRYEAALLAIGLQHETMTTLHVAMLASMMANGGRLTAPRLVRERRSVLDEPVGAAGPLASTQLVPANVAAQVVQAMTAVVTSEKGTGHRAAIDGLTIAMKTGTAGDTPSSPLQAVILAFAPVDHPTIAFGMIAEDSGPAEFAGAKIAHDFLVAVKNRK